MELSQKHFFLLLVNFILDHFKNNVTPNNKWKGFVFHVYFQVPLHESNFTIETCFIDFK